MSSKLPRVVLCGRTNVGKSTLFNRLSESRKAITSDLAGTTRDRNFSKITWRHKEFELIDTGGLDVFDQPELEKNIKKQIQVALQQAEVVLFVLDGKMDLLPQDKTIAKTLTKLKKPIILTLNKIDSLKDEKKIDPNIYKLGFKNIITCSGLNGVNTGDLLDKVTDLLPETKKVTEEKDSLKLALIGQPNVGKSSLLNAIIGEERVVVSDIAHTTRDINDLEFEYQGELFTLIDTAGLRKKSRIGKWKGENNKLLSKIEKEGVSSTLNSVKDADLIVLVLEAQTRINAQDKALVQLIADEGKSLILVLNKWDLIPNKDQGTLKQYQEYFAATLPFALWAPRLFTSAKTKQRVKKILDLALEIKTNQNKEIPDAELAEDLELLLRRYKPRQRQTITHGQKKAPLKPKGLIQVKTNPPTFVLKIRQPKNVPPAIIKLLEKSLRKKYNFTGTPIKIIVEK